MTKKRFRLIDYDDDYFTIGDDIKGEEIDSPFKILDLLNEQDETIQRLKRNFKALDEVKCEIAEENEQLKQILNELSNMLQFEPKTKQFEVNDEY